MLEAHLPLNERFTVVSTSTCKCLFSSANVLNFGSELRHHYPAFQSQSIMVHDGLASTIIISHCKFIELGVRIRDSITAQAEARNQDTKDQQGSAFQ